MRNRRLLTIALATGSLVAVSGIAFAVVQSVDPAPAPQVIIPAASTHSSSHAATTPEPADDKGTSDDNPATHDARDDNGAATTGTDDNTATHDAGDDNGGAGGSGSSTTGSGSGSDDSSGGSGGGHGSDG